MKYVKCVYDGYSNTGNLGIRLTVDKIYEVLDYHINKFNLWQHQDVIITIIDNLGDEACYSISNKDNIWFIDADSIVRDDKINKILR